MRSDRQQALDLLDMMNVNVHQINAGAGSDSGQPGPTPPEPESEQAQCLISNKGLRARGIQRASGQPARKTDPATSHVSAEAIVPQLPRLEQLVLQAIRAYPEGCIADQICLMADLDWRTCTPRLAPLMRKGLIVDTGTVRKGQSGRNQRVVRAL